MKLSIRSKLLGAFGLDLLLMMALGVFALHQMGRMNTQASFVEDRVFPMLSSVHQIHEILVRYRTLQLEHILYTNRADKARIENSMAELEARMEARFADRPSLTSSPEERAAFDRVRRAWSGFVAANHDRFLPATRLANTGTVQPAFSRLNPLYEELTGAADALATLSRQQATEALRTAQADFATSRVFISLDTLASLILSAAIGLALAANIGRRVGRMTRATIAVADGDLERRVEVSGGDELELLAENFNLMVRSLRAERETLELRNAELQHSLERQKQLTEDLILREQAEREAHQAKSQAESASQAKSLFLATMSHELRTPLNAILGYAQLLYLEATKRGQDLWLPELGRIQVAGKHLLALISNILDFSKIEQGKMDLEIVDFDLAQLLEDVVAITEPLALERGNRLILDCAPQVGTMRADPGKLRQILFNLLSNAAKYTEQGTITLRVRRRGSQVGGWLHLEVEDTGSGIAPEEQDRLFQAFGRARSPSSGKVPGGTGLGLVVSRQLCEMMAGTIAVESQVDRGTVFTIRLPFEVPAGGVAASYGAN